MLGLDVSVDGVGDRPVRAAGLMLVDHRRPLAVMPHPANPVPHPRAAGRGEGVARMP